jgi:hypothetical protein
VEYVNKICGKNAKPFYGSGMSRNLTETGHSTDLAQDALQWRALVKVVMKLLQL